MPQIPRRLITYCTNIHAGETWAETFSALQQHIPAIKAAISPHRPFPIGLRLSCRAAFELSGPHQAKFNQWLADQECFIPTINGFPFGAFHGLRIKDRVYLPDWRSSDRAAYTMRLATLLAGWLPEGQSGSISTVPLGYKKAVSRHDLPVMVSRLQLVLAHLARLLHRQGKTIMLALEPEPGCLLETTGDVCSFFASLSLPPRLKKHLAICYDCCHQAVQFEDPLASLRALAAAGVPVAKVQASSAVAVTGDHVAHLQPFLEPCYLHQVVIAAADGALSRYDDLQQALGHRRLKEDLWRCHFHLPLYFTGTATIDTTRQFLTACLPLVATETLLEIETYTWDLLPDDLRHHSVNDSIIGEIKWLEAQLHA